MKLSSFKIQTHKMFFDTHFNSIATVLSTIYKNFVESAMKYYRYAKCMAAGARPHASLLIGQYFFQYAGRLLQLLFSSCDTRCMVHTVAEGTDIYAHVC